MSEFRLPLRYLFWAMLSAYIIHIVEETVVNGGFIAGVRQYIWPTYPTMSFIITNTILIVLIAVSIILYERRGGQWVIFPLTWTIERSINGLFHIWWCFKFATYSPGLLTNVLVWIILYLVLRDNYKQGDFSTAQLYSALLSAIGLEVILLGSLAVLPRIIG